MRITIKKLTLLLLGSCLIFTLFWVTSSVAVANKKATISWDLPNSTLVFSGRPNEVKTGEISFRVNSYNSARSFRVKVNGTAFAVGQHSLNTEYRFSKEETWYKAGDFFIVTGYPGKTYTIYYRVSTGPKISSQYAGGYRAKLSINILSIE